MTFIIAHYHRQGYTQVMGERDFPPITVTEVLEDNLLWVDFLLDFLLGVIFGRHAQRRCNHQAYKRQ